MLNPFKIVLQNKVLLYQSLFGDGDEIHPIVPQTLNFDYRLFSDKFHTTIGDTRVINISKIQDTMYNSRHFKIDPKINFYSRCIYLDASFEIIDPNFIEFMTNLLIDKQFVFFKHPWRDCIFDEVLECNKINKYNLKLLNSRRDYYLKINFPKHYGLYCGGCFSFKNNYLTKKIQKEWWEETIKTGMMDQVSLPYVLWKNNIKKEQISVIDLNIYINNYIKYFPHKKQYVFNKEV